MQQNFDIGRAIGNTPLVELKKINPNPRVRILAKLEGNNPGGSVKDRPAWFMLTGAEARGELTPDKGHPGADLRQYRHSHGDDRRGHAVTGSSW